MHLLKRSHKKLTREELILRSQQDDYLALEELIKREQKNAYASFFYLATEKEDILDLTQEALFRMAKNIKSLRDPKKFQAWFNQIITNLFNDEMRKKYKRPQQISIDDTSNENKNVINISEIKDRKKLPAENTLAGELNKKITDAIHNLPEPFRIAIVLRELQGLSYEEISDITQTSIGTIKSRIARARTKLQESLKPYLIQ
ncbi:sigma-70 family RNA polymerase sigma factor [bacterium]|nr:sigma-70 family RNA polymerase sigma factor [bacterium]